METKRKLKILTARGQEIRIEDEKDEGLSRLPDKITYWQDLDSPFSSEEILDIIRSKFYSLKEPKPFSFVTHEEFREIRKDMEAVKATVTKLDEKVEELMVNLKIPVQDLIEIIDDMKKEGRVVPKGEKIT